VSDDDRSLRVLLAACHAALRDARAGLIEIADAVPVLERLCARIQAELDAVTAMG
jgi:hypothetical protein